MTRTPSLTARAKLLQATIEILLDAGIDHVSVEAIARRSGVAKTTLYRHFGGLEGIVFAAAATEASQTQDIDTGSLLGDLREVQHHYLTVADSALRRSVFAWMLTRALSNPEAAAMFKSARAQPQGPTVIALQRAIARGELSPTINIEMALHLIQGPLMSKRFVDNSALTDTEFETLLTMTHHALIGISS